MEFSDVIRRRRMVRNFDATRAVPRRSRDRLLAAAVRAPSAGFTQGWGFLVLEEAADRERFWAATTCAARPPDRWLSGMRRAPLLVSCLSNRSAYVERYAESDKGWTDRDESHWPVPYWHVDTGFAALMMLLDAVDQELGACFFGVPADRVTAFRTAFEVPHTYTPVGVVAVGYPVPDRRSPSLARGHRPTAEVIRFGRWNAS